MSSTLPILVGAGAAAYLLLKKKKPAGPNVVITATAPIKATQPSGYQMPPTANPADLAIPKSDIVDIHGFGAFGQVSSQLVALSAEVLQYQPVATVKCPKLVESYKELASDINYQMTLATSGQADSGYTATLAAQLKNLNNACNQGVSAKVPAKPAPRTVVAKNIVPDVPRSSGSGSMLALFAVAAVGAYLMFS